MEIWGGARSYLGLGVHAWILDSGSDPKLTLKFHLSNTGCNDEVHANVAFKELRETWEKQQKKGQTEDDVFLMVNARTDGDR